MPRCIFALVFSLIGSAVLQSQFDTGQIGGYVRDASQAVVSGASVTVTNQGNGEQKQTTTNSSGYYVVPNLPVGTYSVTAELAGFKKMVQSGIVLDSAGKLNIDLALTVGAVTESVEVNASATQVQTESAQVGRVVTTKQIQDLTLNGRNPIYLALLKPGVSGGGVGTVDPDSVSNGGVNFNGSRGERFVGVVGGAVGIRSAAF